MTIQKCSICGDLVLGSRHTCKPSFQCVIHPDDPNAESDERGYRIFDYDAGFAAQKYVQILEEAYSSDGGLGVASGGEIDVLVYPYDDWMKLKEWEEELEHQERRAEDAEDEEEAEEIADDLKQARDRVAELKAKGVTYTVTGEWVPEYYATEKKK